MRMLLIFSLLGLSNIAFANTSWTYTRLAMGSIDNAMNCAEHKGDYKSFVKTFKTKQEGQGMNCTDVNETVKDKFTVMCTDKRLNSMTSYWFKTKSECEKALAKRRADIKNKKGK